MALTHNIIQGPRLLGSFYLVRLSLPCVAPRVTVEGREREEGLTGVLWPDPEVTL